MKIPYRFPITRQQARENALYCAKKRQIELGEFWVAVAHTFPETAIDLTDEERATIQLLREDELTTVSPSFLTEAMEAISFKNSTERRRRSGEMYEITSELYQVMRLLILNLINEEEGAIVTAQELADVKRAGWGLKIEILQPNPDMAWRVTMTKP